MKILTNIFRGLFGIIDGIIAKVITQVYDLLLSLANLSLYSDNIVKIVGQRIGVILGIFMLFRLAISLINYMISPEKFSDNKQGGAQLIQNIAISLILLATINIIFRTAYDVQQKIVSSQIIEKVFFGTTTPKYSNGKEDKNIDIGYYLYSSFFVPNKNVIPSCTLEYGDDIWDTSFDLANSECDDELYDVLETNARKSLFDAKNNLDMSKVFLNMDLVNASKGGTLSGTYVFEYTPLISTAVGVIALLLLVSFSLDLATRAVKLLFLQLVAPIPIIFNMDTGKGKEVFQKWYKECFSTYISVFIRLIAIDFAIFIIVLLKGNFKSIFQESLLLNVFIIIGCLMFAKQVPKLIENIMGIKLDGMALHPLKKFEENALFAKQIEGLVGTGLASGAAFASNFASNIYNNQNRRGLLAAPGTLVTALGSGIGGSIGALARGSRGAIGGKGLSESYLTGYRGAIEARNRRIDRSAAGVNSLDILSNRVSRALGVTTEAERQDANIKVYDEFSSSADALISLSESEVQKYANSISLSAGTIGVSAYGFSTLGELREAMNDTTHYTAQQRAEFNKEYENLKGEAEKQYRAFATKGSSALHASTTFSMISEDDINGQTAMAHIQNLEELYDHNKNNEFFVSNGITSIDGTNVKDVNKKIKQRSSTIKNSNEYKRAHKIQEQTNRERK